MAYRFAPRFLWECLTNRTVNPFPAPATSNRAYRFPALGSPARFTTGLWDVSGRKCFRSWRSASAYSTFFRPLPSSPCRIAPCPRVLQHTGRFYHSPLPPLPPRVLRCSRAPWLPGHYSGSPLLRAHPPPSRRQPLSRFSRLYDLPCSIDFAMGRGRFLQLLGLPLSPCCP